MALTGYAKAAHERTLKQARERSQGDDRYVVVPVLQMRDPRHGWPADDEGIELMNTLAHNGWRVAAATANAVVMERPS